MISVIHDDYMQEILGMLELYLESISVRLDIIAAQMYTYTYQIFSLYNHKNITRFVVCRVSLLYCVCMCVCVVLFPVRVLLILKKRCVVSVMQRRS